MSYIIDRQDSRFVDSIVESITHDLAARFPDGVPEQYMLPMTEAMINAYWNGARAAELLLREDDLAVKTVAEGLQ